jgi:peroxiredoxin family protein
MEDISNELLCAVRKKAVGYTAEECVEEYGVNDGQLTLCKRKVTVKEVPPDLSAVKMLIEMDGVDPYEKMSEKELENEKNRLLQLLKEKQK